MIPLNGSLALVEWAQNTGISDASGPMTQQQVGDCHGHEMHPQKFLRLVGCHEPGAEKREGVHRVNQLTAIYPATRYFFDLGRSMRSSRNSGGPSVSLRTRRSRSATGREGSSNWPTWVTAKPSISAESRTTDT